MGPLHAPSNPPHSATIRRLWTFVGVGLLACLACLACSTPPTDSATQHPTEPPAASPRIAPSSTGPFREAATATGLAFTHRNGMTGKLYFHEMMGSGAALFDYDHDGDLDVYLVDSGPIEETASPSRADRLFRNELISASGGPGDANGPRTLHFTDVTEASGLRPTGYGMGVATGDFDNDGWTDLYLTHFGEDQLWRNRGDGTFALANDRLPGGEGDRRWGVPALFADFDRDGWLDLFVGNYVDFTVATHKACTTELGEPNYCGPLAYRPQQDALYRNLGGTFEEISAVAGLRGHPGGALGAVSADFNQDGWLDLYVANDGVPNHLWINQGDGTFQDEALLAGAAVNLAGQPEASMGAIAEDFDEDGDVDLFLTHLARESNTLYLNDGSGLFEDATTPSGLGPPSWEMTGFGTGLLDFDGDGRRDLLVVNGAVKILEPLRLAGDPFPLHQPNQLYRRQEDGTFTPEPTAGTPLALSEVSRGAAFGDLDNDGDTDVVIVNNHGPARLLLNQREAEPETPAVPPRWLGLDLRLGPEHGGRVALGAAVWIFPPGGSAAMVRRVHTDGSYASAGDPRLLITLRQAAPTIRVRVRWPDRGQGGDSEEEEWEEWSAVPTGRYTTLQRGTGQGDQP
jgi:enediyne biosynthesis protein E4